MTKIWKRVSNLTHLSKALRGEANYFARSSYDLLHKFADWQHSILGTNLQLLLSPPPYKLTRPLIVGCTCKFMHYHIK